MCREHPILFTGEMVQAIERGDKTVTRRLVRPQPAPYDDPDFPWQLVRKNCRHVAPTPASLVQAYDKYHKDDFLWVRETWRLVGWSFDDMTGVVEYSDGFKQVVDIESDEEWLDKYVTIAGRNENVRDVEDGTYDGRLTWDESCPLPWKPSIHMPRWASRIKLELASVQIEQLQDITDDDVLNEGLTLHEDGYSMRAVGQVYAGPRMAFAYKWDEINGHRAKWETNPWVWVLRFRRAEWANKSFKTHRRHPSASRRSVPRGASISGMDPS